MNKKPAKFNWLTKLNGIIRRKVKPDIFSAEYRDLSYRSNRWPTCACGQLCYMLPRYTGGEFGHLPEEPKDRTLRRLGIAFQVAIKEQRYRAARTIFRKIESRTAVLLRRMNRKAVA